MGQHRSPQAPVTELCVRPSAQQSFKATTSAINSSKIALEVKSWYQDQQFRVNIIILYITRVDVIMEGMTQ